MYSKVLAIGLFSFLMLIPFMPTSQAELWEFVVELNMEKGEVVSGDNVVVTGRVVDHAYKATRGVEVLVRAGADTTIAFTDPSGEFRAEFKDFQRVPGTYTVNVIASWYGMTGMSSTQFLVKGDSSPVSILQQKLSTDEAIKYLSANESDFERNPIGQTLFKYYHGLLDELIIENKAAEKPNEDQIYVEQQRKIAEDLKEQAIEFYKPGAGTYQGLQYDDYIRNLNPEIQDLVKNQLNFTKNNFINAQIVRDEILANGGTFEEARQAYLELIAIPKETIEQFNKDYINENSQENIEESSEE
ncbi:MAG: carboxypeptidase regulatory-like domain-containing protein [Nitrosopumilus sp.]|nr:carboxypeptidase regulatory-like domain-containing protein [Nitrosopumilus sp.]NNL38005.1 carboxypeptidase regulatory-like domain-containing protein [Nitrosopumilus sp.]